MRTAATTTDTAAAEEGYRQAGPLLDHSGMPGVTRGLLPRARQFPRRHRLGPLSRVGTPVAPARPRPGRRGERGTQALPGTAARNACGGALEPHRASRPRPRRPHSRRRGARRAAARKRRDRRGGQRHAHRRPRQRLPHRAGAPPVSR
jgi:hypothetical protein